MPTTFTSTCTRVLLRSACTPDGSLRSRQLWQLPVLAPQLIALRMDADLDFATATALERYAADALQQSPQTQDLALLMQSINSIDITGVEIFARLERLVALRGGLLHVVGLKLPAEQRLSARACWAAKAAL